MIRSLPRRHPFRVLDRTRSSSIVCRVVDLMTRDPATIAPHTLVVHAERLASSLGVHHLLVADGDHLLGVLCLCDLWHADPDAVALDLMTAPAASIDPYATAKEAADTMNEQAVGCLPVLDGERLTGILTRGDLRRAGVDTDDEVRRCASCGARHHVRASGAGDARNGMAFCLECLERGRAFDCDDPYDELGGGD